PYLLVAEPIDEVGLADHPFAAALLDLAQQPLEVLERLLARRQHIDRVLDRDRAETLQPPPDLDPQIGGLRRQLGNQEKPASPRLRLWRLQGARSVNIILVS